MSDERGNSVGESTLTIKWWGVLVIVLGFFGWMALSVMGQETRITRMETHFSHITQTLEKVSSLTEEIRADQLRRYQQELNRR